MKDELDSLMKNKTMNLCKFHTGKRDLRNKWVTRLKEEDGGKKQFKSKLVVKRFA